MIKHVGRVERLHQGFKKMGIVFLGITLFGFSTALISESFQWELSRKRAEVRSVIGEKKLAVIERAMNQTDIYRITQLLLVDGVGEKTVIKLEKILGTRFYYNSDVQHCRKNKIC